MVRKLLHFLHRESSGIHQAAYLLGFFTISSQLLALIRDRLLAHAFGAGQTLDVYYAAFRIPDFIFATVASLVSISVLIPFLVERVDNSPEKGKQFISNVFSVFFFFIVVVSAVAYFLVPVLLPVLFPNFKGADFMPQLIMLTRILLLSPFFLGISNLFASITQVYNRFFIYAISPLLYNIGIIAGIVFLYPRFGLTGLGIGVVAGAFMHFFIQVPFIIEKGMFPRLTFNINFSEIKRIVFISMPRTLTASANELSELVLISFASLLSAGSISVFNFSWNLQSVPLAVIGVSYSLAVFPTLTRLFSGGDKKQFIEKMIISTKHIIFLSLPVMVLFIVLRAQIVRTILGSGKFSWEDTRLTAAALAIFALSLIPQSLSILFVRAQYSTGKTKKPLYINLISSLFIIASGYGLIKLFYAHLGFQQFITSILRVQDVAGTGVLMLPLAYTVGVTINMLIHWIVFSREFGGFSASIGKTIFQSFIASVILGVVSYNCLSVFEHTFDLSTLPGIFLQGLVSGLIGLFVAALVLWLFKSEELFEIGRTLHGKIWKAKVITQDPAMPSGGAV